MKKVRNNVYAKSAMRDGFASYQNIAFNSAQIHSFSLKKGERSKIGFINTGMMPAH